MSASENTLEKCAGCKVILPASEFLRCCKCKLPYDLECASVSGRRFDLMEERHKTTWECPECVNKYPKTGNLGTPVRHTETGRHEEISQSPSPRHSNVTCRRHKATNSGSKRQKEELTLDINPMDQTELCVSQEMRALCSEISSFRRLITDLKETITLQNNRINILEERVNTLEHRIKDVEADHTREIHQLQATIDEIKIESQHRKQEQLSNDIEIAGFPETPNENPIHIVLSIAKKLDMKLKERDIVSAERAGPPRNAAEGEEQPRARPIAVRLTRRPLRDAMLKAARVRRQATTEGLGLPGKSQSFYINERLSKHNRFLFHKSREIGQRLKWKFIWTRDGKVLARKAQGATRHHIQSEEDIMRVFGDDNVSSHNSYNSSV